MPRMTDPPEGLEPWMADRLSALTRSPSADLASLMVPCCDELVIDGTRTCCRIHMVARDANGHVRVDALTKLLARQIVDFCIPRSRMDEANEQLLKTGSAEELLRLQDEARELFSSLERSGEAGELLLYMLLERMLGLPQLLCKMNLKTSSAMHVHGTDGIHGRMCDDGTLGLYWGESKLHKTFESAVDDCFRSLAPYLGRDPGARQRDLLLLRDHVNVDDERLIDALRRYFVESSPEAARVEFRGACLVGFDLDEYPDVGDEALVSAVSRWQERVSGRVGRHSLENIEIEFFCIPFPSVDAFRAGVHAALGSR
jgi:hypothetical protein